MIHIFFLYQHKIDLFSEFFFFFSMIFLNTIYILWFTRIITLNNWFNYCNHFFRTNTLLTLWKIMAVRKIQLSSQKLGHLNLIPFQFIPETRKNVNNSCSQKYELFKLSSTPWIRNSWNALFIVGSGWKKLLFSKSYIVV